MPNENHHRVEVITGLAGRRYWPAHEKLRIIEESLVPGESVSAVARRNGVAPNLLFRWRRLMDEGGAMAVGSNEPVVGASEVRKLEDKVRALERMLGRKTMENEILREALDQAGQKNRRGICRRCRGTVPVEPRGRGAGGEPVPAPCAGLRRVQAPWSLQQGGRR